MLTWQKLNLRGHAPQKVKVLILLHASSSQAACNEQEFRTNARVPHAPHKAEVRCVMRVQMRVQLAGNSILPTYFSLISSRFRQHQIDCWNTYSLRFGQNINSTRLFLLGQYMHIFGLQCMQSSREQKTPKLEKEIKH